MGMWRKTKRRYNLQTADKPKWNILTLQIGTFTHSLNSVNIPFSKCIGKKKHDTINMKGATQRSKYSLLMKPRVTFVFAYLEKYLKTLIVLLFLGKKETNNPNVYNQENDKCHWHIFKWNILQ